MKSQSDTILSIISQSDKEGIPTNVFTETTAFLTNSTIANWRRRSETVLIAQSKETPHSKLVDKFYSDIQINDIITPIENIRSIPDDKFSASNLGSTERTLALAHLLTKNCVSLLSLNFDMFLQLMCTTSDVSTYLTMNNLSKLVEYLSLIHI